MKSAKIGKEILRRMTCDLRWSGDAPKSDHVDLCGFRHKMPPHRKRDMRDTIQSLEINGLKSEVSRLGKLVDMLLVLVDPEDVQAALRIEEFDLSHEELMELADESTPPAELHGKE